MIFPRRTFLGNSWGVFFLKTYVKGTTSYKIEYEGATYERQDI